MRRIYAEIRNNLILCVNEYDYVPEFPDTICIDITDMDPRPDAWWSYDPATQTFTPPKPPDPPLTPAQSAVHQTKKDPIIHEVVQYGNLYVRKLQFTQAGTQFMNHKHFFDHISLLTKGAMCVNCTGQRRTYYAPSVIQIPKDTEHQITALVDDTHWWCVFAVRDDQGEVLESSEDILTKKADPKSHMAKGS